MKRVLNFSAGPGVMPEPVLERAAAEMSSWGGRGLSVMEMSHRSDEFIEIAARAEAGLRSLMGIPAGHKVLFLQGGATLQFAMVPVNLRGEGAGADYLDTGQWSKKAIDEARKSGPVNVVASGAAGKYTGIPARDTWACDPAASYLHYTSNETIGGVQFHHVPDAGGVPLVCDMSSDILSGPVDVSRFGVIYAGAQKNIGPAGLTVVIVREDLLGRAPKSTPAMLDYAVQSASDSMYNTPPTWAIYIAGLVFDWLHGLGGLGEIARRNADKAKLLYDLFDTTEFYRCPVAVADRSLMNVPFTLCDAKLDDRFLAEAEAAGLQQLKGHRSVGGMRASLYNAMPRTGVETLAAFMREFERRHG
ncbi:MAG: 3-phosphoserine/phosphohydroxythreonine transaminase [bacterium]|jgi:phosphoserine aminotransferase|nr:3-phosphoserine/phosphohydroxythreonine transaminase [Betaproteobacteria bacterium]